MTEKSYLERFVESPLSSRNSHGEEARLVKAIADDEPFAELVYADWLDERGDCRSEFWRHRHAADNIFVKLLERKHQSTFKSRMVAMWHASDEWRTARESGAIDEDGNETL